MKLKIKVTKDVLRRSMLCSSKGYENIEITENCAIAIAMRDIFPKCAVGFKEIVLRTKRGGSVSVFVDNERFIRQFDSLKYEPAKRLELPEYEFEITVPDVLIDEISINDIIKSETLELA